MYVRSNPTDKSQTIAHIESRQDKYCREVRLKGLCEEVCLCHMLQSKIRYVMRSASPHSSVKITWKLARKLVTLM